jgi:hypothetical protein
MVFAISLLPYAEDMAPAGCVVCLRYFWTFELCVTFCARVLGWSCARCCIAYRACCERTAFTLDANQRSIYV